MREGWKEEKIEDLCISVKSGGTPSTKRNDFYGGKIPWIKTKEVNFNRIYDSENKITELGLKSSSAKLIPARSIIIAMYGNGDTAGRCAINMIPLATNQACSNFTFKEEVASPEFMFYKITTHYRDFVHLKSGGAQNNLNGRTLKDFKVKIPPLKTQRKIASILSAYDDLIENNLKRIKLLEEQAQQTYEEWFVRFKFPGYEEVGIDEASGLPIGWEKVKASKKIKLISGYAFKGKEFTDIPNEHIAVRMGNFKVGGGLKFDKSKYLIDSSSVREKFHLKHNDLLMVLSDVTREGLLIGNVGFLPNDGRNYYLNQRVSKVEVEENFKMYAYAVFNSPSFKQNCISKANSVTVLNLKNDDIYGYEMIIPSKQIIGLWNKIYGSSIKMTQNLTRQNQLLKEARDILLPRLMMGVIDVEDMEVNIGLGSDSYRKVAEEQVDYKIKR